MEALITAFGFKNKALFAGKIGTFLDYGFVAIFYCFSRDLGYFIIEM